MIKNLIIVALRNFWKEKGYSLLNVLGLTIGISFSMLLLLYVLDELSYDKYHEKYDRIYRIVSYVDEPNNSMKWAITQFPLGPTLKRDYPEVEHAIRFVPDGRNMYSIGDRKFSETRVFLTDSNFFEVFTHKFLEGDPKTALNKPNSIVLTRDLAERYFGKDKPAVGQSLKVTSSGDMYSITGVIENVPKNSHILFNALVSMNTLPREFQAGWGEFSFYTYVLLNSNVNKETFEKKLEPMYDKYVAPIFAQYNIKVKYGVQPIADIHLKSDFDQEPEELGSMSYIYIFTSVALFMLLIACINYMNLTTARSARRAKEIGIRKVAGSTRPQLIAQFMTESVVLTVISLLISLGLLYFLLPLFNSLAGKFLSYKNILQPVSLLVLFGIVVFVGVLGGSYPALYLSKFNSVSVLKGTLSKASANVALRRVLVTVQFSISMVMIICTWVVYSQLNFMKEKDLGFNKDQVLSFTITANGNVRAGAVGMMDEIRKNPHVVSVSSANAPPGSPNVFFNLFSIETSEGFREKGVDTYSIDGKYLDALGIKLVKGRNFTIPADTLNSVIVNESMVKAFGWRDQPLGKKIKFPGDTSNRHLEVVGVIQDFHQKSLYNPISPLLLFHRPILRTFLVKISPGHIPETLKELENTWKKFYPEQPFSFTFMDDDFNSQYAADQKRGKIFTSFSLLTILITCLGLIGLIAFTTEQRQKEISIRKVMGAGTTQIVPLIAKNFVMMVCISCLIAFPIAWYFMNKWMEVFPYKVGLQASAFILSALLVLFITVVTISFHTIKVAIANPVKSLRTE